MSDAEPKVREGASPLFRALDPPARMAKETRGMVCDGEGVAVPPVADQPVGGASTVVEGVSPRLRFT